MVKEKLLFRAENKTTISCKYHVVRAFKFKNDRNTKKLQDFEYNRHKMSSKRDLGFDQTPLLKYIQSNIGRKYDDVYSEFREIINNKYHSQVKNELLKTFKLAINTSKSFENITRYFRFGEASYYTLLTVDENGLIVKAHELYNLGENSQELVTCTCCTYTLDGKIIKLNKHENSKC